MDLSLLDLFQSEAQTHSKVLEQGLLMLEKNQTAENVAPLMRAAHSLKGASRIVGLDEAVKVAHVMEDILELSKKGELKLNSKAIDLLLQGSDIFTQLATLNLDSIPAWLSDNKAKLEQCAKLISEIPKTAMNAEPSIEISQAKENVSVTPAAAAQPETPAAQATAPAKVSAAAEHADNSVVRVSAESLNRLMGLAGECLIEAKNLAPLSQELIHLKDLQSETAELLASLSLQQNKDAGSTYEDLRIRLEEMRQVIAAHYENFDLFSSRLEHISDDLYREVIESRMRPFSDGTQGFARMIREQAKCADKQVDLEIVGASTLVDRDILERLEAPLIHILRNAVDHGIERPEERIKTAKTPCGRIVIEAKHRAGMLTLTIKDDGRGIDQTALRKKIVERGLVSKEMSEKLDSAELFEFMFLPGFSTASQITEYSGRGIGLDVVQKMIQEVSGSLKVDSILGKGSTFYLQLPLTLSVQRALLVEIGQESYAIPLTRIDRTLELAPEELKTIEDRPYFTMDGEHIGLVSACQIFKVAPPREAPQKLSIVVVSDRISRYGIIVDSLKGQHELVIKPLDPKLKKVPDINSAAILENRMPVLIIDVDDLVRSIDNLLARERITKLWSTEEQNNTKRKRILVVDDSLTVREVERRLLQSRGYEVEVAVDGMDGWNALHRSKFSLVITDIDMPRMNGIELSRKIKTDEQLKGIPLVIISYKDREEDRVAGLEAGADYYLSKSSFHDQTMIRAVIDLIGEP